MGLTWVLSAPGGPHMLAPWTLLSGNTLKNACWTATLSPTLKETWPGKQYFSLHQKKESGNMMTLWHGNIFRVTGPFVQGIHRSPVNSPHKGQWRGASVFSLIYAWINSWVNNREAGYLRGHRAHDDVIVMNFDISSDFQYNLNDKEAQSRVFLNYNFQND